MAAGDEKPSCEMSALCIGNSALFSPAGKLDGKPDTCTLGVAIVDMIGVVSEL